MRKAELHCATIKSIYFGGGTPSLLHISELELLIDEIYGNFKIDLEAEITLEANPDDLTKKKIEQLRCSPVNRLSIGVQSSIR